MKKRLLIIGLLALMILLVGCKNKIDVSQASYSDKEDVEKVPEATKSPEPAQVPAVEEPKAPEPAAAPEEIKTVPQNEFKVSKGDSFTFGKYTVTVKDIQSSSDVVLDINGDTVQFYETKSAEIFGDMLLTYADSNFSRDRTIIFRAEDFALKENEFILKYKEKITVHGDTIKIDDLFYDEGFKKNAIWVSATSDLRSQVKILEGKEAKIGKVNVKALMIKDGKSIRQYAHLQITPVA